MKPSEPPAGLAKLSGALHDHRVAHVLLDASSEGILHLIHGSAASDRTPRDTWSTRAGRNVSRNLDLLRSHNGYALFSRYRKAVADTNRLLQISTPERFRLSLADYSDRELSPVKSVDLLAAAERPGGNPFFPYFRERLTALIETHNAIKLVGISLSYLSQALCAFSMIGFLKHEFPRLRIVLGGGLVTSWMSDPAWRNPFGGLVDEIVSGPGEGPLLSMLGAAPPQDLSSSLSFDGLHLGDYLSPGTVLPYSASTGCYWKRCSFCPERAEDNAYRPLATARVITDLHALSDRYHPALIHLIDNALSPALLRVLVRQPVRAPWYGFARFIPDFTDAAFCRSLRESGCVMLKLGLESGDQSVLDELTKGIELDTVSRALRTLTQAGISTYVYLLFGTPQEDRAAAERTMHFVARHHDSIDFLNAAIFNLPRNCPDAADLQLRSFYEGDLSLYADFVHPNGWNRREVRLFLEREFKRHPAIRPIILRQPPFFTSNHAPFFSRQTAAKA